MILWNFDASKKLVERPKAEAGPSEIKEREGLQGEEFSGLMGEGNWLDRVEFEENPNDNAPNAVSSPLPVPLEGDRDEVRDVKLTDSPSFNPVPCFNCIDFASFDGERRSFEDKVVLERSNVFSDTNIDEGVDKGVESRGEYQYVGAYKDERVRKSYAWGNNSYKRSGPVRV